MPRMHSARSESSTNFRPARTNAVNSQGAACETGSSILREHGQDRRGGRLLCMGECQAMPEKAHVHLICILYDI